MAKKLVGKLTDTLTRCLPCSGTGKVPHYTQGCNPITKNGRTVADTSCTVFKKCPHCGGSGRTR
ncbi:hypothetical protein [Micromonospora endolithica]|uniref:Uncharacterized protein n=1 Tax=Micromonospora endolithica TaxID=230091 RepID=A0A3A9ZAF6_9ACTN|nr:hypothetical protein [Micromonospora endolithica]RKN44307.1 hypothetical protein D7223_18750 [Micromonospora endolithica]TWJ25784.1 hypothetical protein JD76_05958 [Micromonospora endolithica]